ncbi:MULTISPECIES: hypothetical protein [unclassified Nocardioides]|uniref:hypothetical protein n=1 Tax=unclassified Nocardioides TaxID=2615069 RepID=UPI0006F7BC76|nr:MULTISPECIES: hypothetical protein [unclassified Nocardioides]KQY54251.1 hypothetical protein ASD30_18720 [Nocardioides sp. Root140]KRF10402.1 hypothetical protein ASH02_20020 [Nocardioides sp. Soil796]
MTNSPNEPGPAPSDKNRHIEPEDVPAEEHMETADISERVDLDPEEQVNRPDQTDDSIADAETPEDR